LQPHTPSTQAAPAALPVQSTHAAPHAAGNVSGWQVPLEAQHVPAVHAPSPAWPQAAAHTWARHVGVAPVHPVQVPPPLPQAPLEVPVTQLAWLQQPPLHAL
jgi:hypothetical protein